MPPAMRSSLRVAGSLLLAAATSVASAQDHGGHSTPYAGLQTREISSISDADIDEIRRGSGWGLALPAELNGWPGPTHLLELAAELDLTEEQIDEIDAVKAQMRRAAIDAGDRFLAAERSLDAAFASGEVDESLLRNKIERASTARAELRLAHLAAHLRTPEILTEAQIERYSALRGYGEDDCGEPPAGHDPAMWRRHNGCD